MEGRRGDYHSGELRREGAEAKSERIIQEERQRLGWTEADPLKRRKSDPEKLALGTRLRQETLLSIKQIAARLHWGSSKSANANLHSQGARFDLSGLNAN